VSSSGALNRVRGMSVRLSVLNRHFRYVDSLAAMTKRRYVGNLLEIIGGDSCPRSRSRSHWIRSNGEGHQPQLQQPEATNGLAYKSRTCVHGMMSLYQVDLIVIYSLTVSYYK